MKHGYPSSRDPRTALLASDEPSARFVTLTAVLGKPENDAEVRRARKAVVDDPRVRALVDRLPDSESGSRSRDTAHRGSRPISCASFTAWAFARATSSLSSACWTRCPDIRPTTALPDPGGTTGQKPAAWASLPCDHFAILEVLLLFGRKDAPGVDRALARVRETFAGTAQGPAWHCIPDTVAKWRGPGRKNDACLQVTVEALRLFGLVDATERPKQLTGAARTLLGAWRNRTKEKPCMFGHGKRFVLGKWPPTWYDARRSSRRSRRTRPSGGAGPPRRRTRRAPRRSREPSRPRSVPTDGHAGVLLQGFKEYSFGQKKKPSPWATARVCGLLRVFSAIADGGRRRIRLDPKPGHAGAMPDEEEHVVGT